MSMNVAMVEAARIQRIANGAGSATTAITSSAVDMAGYDRVLFLAAFGTVGEGSKVKMTLETSDDGSTNWTATKCVTPEVTGGGAGAHSNRMIVLDVTHPNRRFARVVITRAEVASIFDGAFALPYSDRDGKATQTVGTGQHMQAPHVCRFVEDA